MDHFDTNAYFGGGLVGKFSMDFNSYRHWDYVIGIYSGFYSFGGTPNMSLDPRETKKSNSNQKNTQKMYFILVWNKENELKIIISTPLMTIKLIPFIYM